MSAHIRGLLFDKDGTLFDFRATWGAWAARLFVDLTEGDTAMMLRLTEAIGFDLQNRRFRPDSVVVAHTAREVAAAIAGVVPGWSEEAMLEHVNATAAEAAQVPPVPLAPLLGGFRASGLRLGVATNDAEAPTRAHLGAAGVSDLFDFIAGYDSGFGAKPGTGMHEAFCNRAELAPEQVAMIGDSPHDLISGRAAGMRTVAVLTGISGREELAEHADAVLKDIGELPAWLESL